MRTQNLVDKLLVVSEGYKMIRAYRVKGEDRVEWGWRMEVRNKSSQEIFFSVHYQLVDGDGFTVSGVLSDEQVNAGKRKVLQGTGSMPYEQMERVRRSKWELIVTPY